MTSRPDTGGKSSRKYIIVLTTRNITFRDWFGSILNKVMLELTVRKIT